MDKSLRPYGDQLDFIRPKSRKSGMVQFIKNNLNDLCVSRANLSWGTPVDLDPKHVAYVWLDALTDYTTAIGYGFDDDSDYRKYWSTDVHLIGKEIVRSHTIIWLAILMAMNLPLPKQMCDHGRLLFGDGSKTSKGGGNVTNPMVLCDRYGVGVIQCFLLYEIPFRAGGNSASETLISHISSDLTDDLDNLVSHTTVIMDRYLGGVASAEQERAPIDDELGQAVITLCEKCDKVIDSYQFSNALTGI